ncbi:Tar DNA-binding protein [Dirofilaria immitis]
MQSNYITDGPTMSQKKRRRMCFAHFQSFIVSVDLYHFLLVYLSTLCQLIASSSRSSKMDGEQICSSDESLKSVCAPEEWVVVSNAIGSKAIEIPVCPSHGVLHLRTVRNVFKDATGLKYRNPDTGLDRVLSMNHDETSFLAPSGGWKNKLFTVVRPVKFVRLQGNAKKQVKRSLADKSKTIIDMDANFDRKMRHDLASSKVGSGSVIPESAC